MIQNKLSNKECMLLKNSIQNVISVDDSVLDKVCALFHSSKVKKGNNILHVGDKNNNFYFIISGMIRFYYLSQAGKESNFSFIWDNHFSCTKGGDPKLDFGIDALEDSYYLYADINMFEELQNECIPLKKFSEQIVNIYMKEREILMQSLLQDSARQRYFDFKKRFPFLVKKLHQYQIASYLGITDVTLSRVQQE